MASPTDLDGFLRNDPKNLTLELAEWFTKIAGKTANVALHVRFKSHGAMSWDKLNGEEPITVKVDAAGVGNIVSKLENLITSKLGSSPFGTLRVIGYQPKQSSNPDLDIQRTMVPAESGGLGEPNVTLLRGELAAERAKNQHLTNIIGNNNNQLMTLVGTLAQANAQLSTLRGVGSTAGDLAGLPQLLALAALMMGWPAIKAALGLPSHAPIHEVIDVARRKMGEVVGLEPPKLPGGSVTTETRRAGVTGPPFQIPEGPGGAPEPPGPPGDSPPPASPGPGDQGLQTDQEPQEPALRARRLIDEFKRGAQDPETQRELLPLLLSDPEFRQTMSMLQSLPQP